ncbi:ATP-binding protein [Umezawaea tangerina]|uniref:Serine/threonine-protein kinase RsbW n=1 Tax=Umezawaea tangerina TaxID=84725 RepID=A0A2T0SK06_9PSEU|nr:ATP-binding protein [Umezawaea tangerina]PRY33746.1 serine/threonine-protein kinase RsbW [Umezawaea tangerina]
MGTPEQGPATTTDLDIRVPAGPAHLSSIRIATSGMAQSAAFDSDTVAELVLAVDEACSLLIRRASEGARLTCHFAVAHHVLLFRAQVSSPSTWVPKTTSFCWRVISSLADSASTMVDADGMLHIELRRREATLL